MIAIYIINYDYNVIFSYALKLDSLITDCPAIKLDECDEYDMILPVTGDVDCSSPLIFSQIFIYFVFFFIYKTS